MKYRVQLSAQYIVNIFAMALNLFAFDHDQII